MTFTQEEIEERFRDSSVDGRITCSAALNIARDLGISTKGVAVILTEIDIKIVNCQLGCFE